MFTPLIIDCDRSRVRGALWGVALALLLLIARPLHAGTLPLDDSPQSPAVYGTSFFAASNWAGYAVQDTGSGTTAQTGVANYVSGSWIVPAVSASLSPSASTSNCVCMIWVGLDGFSDSTVEQLGTACTYDAGTTTYYAWYEMYPNGSVSEFNVNPGDAITASVQYNPPSDPGTFLLTLTDSTLNKSFSVYQSDSSAQRSSAEWIVEAPTGFQGIAPLPYFGSESFTAATATLGSSSSDIDNPAWQTWDINMIDSKYGDAMNPTAPTDFGSGAAATSDFTVNQVPEPAAIAILAAGLAIVGALRCLHRHKS